MPRVALLQLQSWQQGQCVPASDLADPDVRRPWVLPSFFFLASLRLSWVSDFPPLLELCASGLLDAADGAGECVSACKGVLLLCSFAL